MLKNILTLMTGVGLAQVINIIISPVLTRLFIDEQFGYFSLFLSTFTLFSVISTGRYEYSILLPKKKSEALHLFQLTNIINIITFLLFTILIVLFFDLITNLLKFESNSNWLYLIPLSVLIFSQYQSLNFLSNRIKLYSNIAKSKVLQSIFLAISSVSIGYFFTLEYGLIYAHIVGQLSALIIILIYTKKYLKQISFSYLKLLVLAKKYKKFPLANMPHAFINALKEFLSILLINSFFLTNILGQYYLVMRILKIPIILLGTSISQVFYKHSIEKYNKNIKIQNDVKKLFFKLILIGFAPFIIIYLLSESLFTIFFGESWSYAGQLAKAISLYIYFHFIAAPLTVIPMIFNKQDTALIWGLIESILFIGSIIIGNYFYSNLIDILWLISIVMPFYFIAYFYWLYKISGNEK